ncbi:HalOD1 output domain-containing protein [Salinigranum sp.]|uniref:HalOD1 output domain-containing protein n=1 Tax=Salinigranum sp. TaxID=1966351 RepID=UPI0035630535
MTERVLVRVQFDPASGRSVSVAVAEALSLVVESAIDLPPLAYSIDTDSLDALFATRTGPPPSELRLTFPYQRWQVTVSGAGEICISDRSEPEMETD